MWHLELCELFLECATSTRHLPGLLGLHPIYPSLSPVDHKCHLCQSLSTPHASLPILGVYWSEIVWWYLNPRMEIVLTGVHLLCMCKGRWAEGSAYRHHMSFNSECQGIGFNFAQPHLLYPTYQKAADPVTGGGRHADLVSLMWSSSWIKAVNPELKSTTRQDPSTYPWVCMY